jgi:hypothetical protein
MALHRLGRFVLLGLVSVGVVLFCVSSMAQSTVPLPSKRPPDLTPEAPEPRAPSPIPVQPIPEDNDTLRAQVLESRRLVGEALPPINDNGGCMIAAPVRLDAIILADGAKVILMPAVVMRASLASAIADWVREDIAPAVPKGDRLASIEGVGAYQCRTRNSIAGAKMSEHAIGNAFDVHVFRTAHGKLFVIAPSNTDSADVKTFRAQLKKTACERFSTVLGPGADAFHGQHLHVDLEVRRHGTHLCQWGADWPAPTPNAPKP